VRLSPALVVGPLAAFVAAPAPAPNGHVQEGPAKVSLGHHVTLELASTDVFIDASGSKAQLAKGGNFMDDHFIGVVIPKVAGAHDWRVLISYVDDGHIDDSHDLDSAKAIESLRNGAMVANPSRKQNGAGDVIIDRWIEAPRYEEARHHMTWTVELHTEVNGKVHAFDDLETRILGRTGFLSLGMSTAPEHLAENRLQLQRLLGSMTFDSGSRYEDFDRKTDRVASHGFAGLLGDRVGDGVLSLHPRVNQGSK
jgi:uncharacterized membrane-anchored protein